MLKTVLLRPNLIQKLMRSLKGNAQPVYRNHDLGTCIQSNQERSRFLFKKKLCYGCVNIIFKHHTCKTCKKTRSCKVCNKKHFAISRRLKVERKTRGNNTKAKDSKYSSTHNMVAIEGSNNKNYRNIVLDLMQSSVH